jgi:hypothetical protein
VRPFTKDQPKAGDTILHCGHLRRDTSTSRPAYWFKYEAIVQFGRPDGTRGEAAWLAVCEPCFVEHGNEVPARGVGQWIGDAPVIEKVEN